MKEDTKIILRNSPDIVEYKTVQGWVGKNDGRFYGKDESLARYANSTHHICECGGIASKSYTVCDACISKRKTEQYKNMPFKEWNGEPLVIFNDDTYFFDSDELEDYCYDNEVPIEELQLVICEPNKFRGISSEYWYDDLPDDAELPKEFEDKLTEFNKFIETLPPASWSAGKFRTEYKPK